MNKTNPDEPCRLACTEPPQCDGEQLESFGITSNEVSKFRYRSGQCGGLPLSQARTIVAETRHAGLTWTRLESHWGRRARQRWLKCSLTESVRVQSRSVEQHTSDSPMSGPSKWRRGWCCAVPYVRLKWIAQSCYSIDRFRPIR